MFDAFYTRFVAAVQHAKDMGTFDDGVADIKGEAIRLLPQQDIINTDATTGAETKHYTVEVDKPTKPITYGEVGIFGGNFWQNNTTKRYYHAKPSGSAITDVKTGRAENKYMVSSPTGNTRYMGETELTAKFRPITAGSSEVKQWWDNEVANLPPIKTSKVHIFGGAILPIWNQLKAGGVSRLRIVRVQTDAGERVVGVQIPAQKVNLLLRRFGLGENPTTAKDIINEVRENKGSVTLQVPQISAGRPVRVVPGRLGGVDTVELENIPSNLTAQALQFGLIAERIDYKQRWFLPSQREVEVLEDVLKAWPAKVEETNEEGPQADADAEFADFVKDLPAKTQGATFKYSDPRLESDHKQSHGLSKSTFFESAKEAAAHIRQRLTRGAHEHLPRTAQFAPLRHELLRLQKQRSIVADRAINNMRRIVEGMTGDEYNVFERLVLVRDLAQEEKAGRQLPGYWTPELVNTELMRLNAHAQEMPIVQDALNIRNDSWDDLKRRYEKAMKQIGENVTQKFQREDYYRHQVLNYAQTMAPESSRSKLRNPITAGYLKQRKGKSIENKETGKAQSINTFYLQAEFEVMSNMLYDIERANVLAMVESIYSITKDLKAQARSLNDAKIKSYFVSVAKATGAENPQEEGARMYRIAMNQAQAIGFSKLQKLADKELLPEGSAGQWTDVIESIQAGDMNDDIFRYLAWGLRVKDPALSPVASQIFAGIREKRKFTKETLQQIGQYTDWRDLINKDTHRAWQPRDGNVMFMAYSVPERLANQLVEGELEKIGLTKDDLAKMFAIGGKHREYVIPHEVANQLDDLAPNIAKSTFGKYAKEIQTRWKWWTLLAPRRALKYNFRNVTGDADAVFVGNPDTFKYMHKAMSELYQYFTTGVIPDGNKTLSDWVGYGGMQSLLQTQELTELDKLKQFKGIIDKNPTAMERLKSVPLAYAKFVRLGTDYREALLRYASYLSYLNQIEKNGGKPDNFGASIRQEVMALRSNEDKAYWLSNDLLGAYDDVSVIGQELRSRWYPFWSWKEVNTKRYIRFWKNAMQDGRLMMTVGRKVAGLTVRSPLLLIKLGKLTVASHVLWGMLQAWNYLVFGDEEEELPESIKSRPHIILYKKDNGEIVYFHQLGAVGDFMQWVGAEDWPYMVKDLLNGRTTLPEIVKKVAKSPVNIIWQGLRPEAKIAVEQIGGKSTYPDVFKPRTVRDKAEAMFRVLQLEEEYKLVRGMPSRGYGKGWEKAAWYTIDADRAAYITIYDEKERFKRLRGEEYTGGGFVSAKSNALYNFKLALRYKDKVAAEKFLLEYASLGGTKAGIKASMKSLHPLNGLSEEKQKAFVRYLDDDGRKKLIQALRHYESVVKLTDQGEQFMGVLLSDTLSEKGKKRLAKIGIDKIFLKDD